MCCMKKEAAIRKNNDLRFPLVVRSNIYDCVDWMLTSEWDDDDFGNFHRRRSTPLALPAVRQPVVGRCDHRLLE